jgi:hypothetical protein
MVVSRTFRANPKSWMEQPGWSWSSTVVPDGSATGHARSTILTQRGHDNGCDAQKKNKGPGPSGLVRRLPPTAVRAVLGLRGRRARYAPASDVSIEDRRLLAARAVFPGSRQVGTASVDIAHLSDRERSCAPGRRACAFLHPVPGRVRVGAKPRSSSWATALGQCDTDGRRGLKRPLTIPIPIERPRRDDVVH